MDEVEQQSKQIRYNAEQLENLCSDRMSQLYQEKRKSRKQYQEEHAKIVSQFAHVSLTRTTSDLPNPTRCINKFSEKSSKFFGNSMELQLISQEWERKLHLFSWTWWTDTLEPRDLSYEHEKNEKKSLGDDAADLIYIFSAPTHVPSSSFEVLFWKKKMIENVLFFRAFFEIQVSSEELTLDMVRNLRPAVILWRPEVHRSTWKWWCIKDVFNSDVKVANMSHLILFDETYKYSCHWINLKLTRWKKNWTKTSNHWLFQIREVSQIA